MLSCYEFIEKFIGCVSDHLEDLIKQRCVFLYMHACMHFNYVSILKHENIAILLYSDCPEECKEAIPSLIYAAARISDLPELRDLRTVFTEKYENSLEPYISKEVIFLLRKYIIIVF